MKACFVSRSLWLLKCCFLYVPTLRKLSHFVRLNERVYSQIPTECVGAPGAQCTLVTLRSSFPHAYERLC